MVESRPPSRISTCHNFHYQISPFSVKLRACFAHASLPSFPVSYLVKYRLDQCLDQNKGENEEIGKKDEMCGPRNCTLDLESFPVLGSFAVQFVGHLLHDILPI